MGITGFEMVAIEVWAHKHIDVSNKCQRDPAHKVGKSWFTLNLIDGIFVEPRVCFSWRRFPAVTAEISATIGKALISAAN